MKPHVMTLALSGGIAALLLAVSTPTWAVPSFARQTGFDCVQCHLSWPELTSIGRQFKLGGYTLMKEASGERPLISFAAEGPPPELPLAAMLQFSVTNTRSTATDPSQFPRNNAAVVQQASLFYAGRLAEHFGAFVQGTFDGVEERAAIDNVDLRAAGRHSAGGLDVAYGLTVNNNPTVSDIYNSTPAWGFPFASSSVAAAPNAATLIDGGLAQQVVGLGAYAMWNETLYTEIAGYRTADGAFSIFRAGTNKSEDVALSGVAPYWRVALQHVWEGGTHSAMVGTYGIDARKFPDSLDPTGATDRYLDVAVDAQYQYITDAHRFSAQASWIKEKQSLDASYASGAASNTSDTLKTFRGKLTYYYDRQYGGTLAYFRTTGTADDALYNTGEPVTGSASASPNSSGYVFELDWLPRRDIRIAAQFTAYSKFNGDGTNYDGFGRNAKDNNTFYLIAWLMF
jgi:hypothetical protein